MGIADMIAADAQAAGPSAKPQSISDMIAADAASAPKAAGVASPATDVFGRPFQESRAYDASGHPKPIQFHWQGWRKELSDVADATGVTKVINALEAPGQSHAQRLRAAMARQGPLPGQPTPGQTYADMGRGILAAGADIAGLPATALNALMSPEGGAPSLMAHAGPQALKADIGAAAQPQTGAGRTIEVAGGLVAPEVVPPLVGAAARGLVNQGRYAKQALRELPDAIRGRAPPPERAPVPPPLGGLRPPPPIQPSPTTGYEAPPTGMASPQSMGAAAVDQGALAQGAHEPLGQPVKGGLPPSTEAARIEALQRVGITQARESAIAGDANAAGVDAALTRFDADAAGQAAGAHFQNNELAPLKEHAENIVRDVGGSLDVDENALYRRGQTIATPFDRFRDWLSAQIDGLYTEARNRGNTTPPTQLGRLNELLNGTTPESMDFQGQLGASQDGERLLNAARSKLQRDLEANPAGLNATQAENTRKFFNSEGVWSPERAWAVNRMHQAMDYDVAEAAGGDLFERARAAYQTREQLLNDPKGILKLFDSDPNTPINRATPYKQIPDALVNLDPDQLQHVMNVLQDMQHVPELAADANAALGEIRAQYVNRMLERSTKTGGVTQAGRTPRVFWDADGVNKYLADSSRRRDIIFDGAPEANRALDDLQNAGNILKVDPNYRGAAAQGSNAAKFVEGLGPWAGGALGMATGIPGADVVGTWLGNRTAGRWAARMNERHGVGLWNKGVRDITAVEGPPRAPLAYPDRPPPPWLTPSGGAGPAASGGPTGGTPAPAPAPAAPSAGGGAATPRPQPPSPRASWAAEIMERLRQSAENAAPGPARRARGTPALGPQGQDFFERAGTQPAPAVAQAAAPVAPPAATRSEPVTEPPHIMGGKNADALGLTDEEVKTIMGNAPAPPGFTPRQYAGLMAMNPATLGAVRGSTVVANGPRAATLSAAERNAEAEQLNKAAEARWKERYATEGREGESYEDYRERMAQEEEKRGAAERAKVAGAKIKPPTDAATGKLPPQLEALFRKAKKP